MKKSLLVLSFFAITQTAICQPTAGLIAHWNMDSTTNDVTGLGHDGHGINLVPATGMDGIPGHAWYFNGVNSSMTAPYQPDLNLTAYTFAATIMVQGFYTGPCHGNVIISRGSTGPSHGAYYLVFSDVSAGYGCTTAMDTNQESFIGNSFNSSGGSLAPASYTLFDHTPHIQTNMWYNVVATFNDTVFKVYVNNVLMSSVLSPTPGVPIGPSTDSMSLGYCVYTGTTGYPYRFHGIMDDARIYDRALNSCEVAKLTFLTNSLITAAPVNDTVSIASTATFSISDTGGAATYQWQVNTGSGFTNLTAAAPYSGVTTKILTVNPVALSMNNYQYRCIRSVTAGACIDTSSHGKLVISTTGINDVTKCEVAISPNPATGFITVAASANIETIEIVDLVGRKLIIKEPKQTTTSIDIKDLKPGIYLLVLNNNTVRKFIKE